jgi:uncharacterized protein
MHPWMVHFFLLFLSVAFAERKRERGPFLKEEIGLLIELQKIDTDIGKINLKKKDLPLQLVALDESFANFKSAVKETMTRLDDVNKRHKETEDKLKKSVEGLRKAKEKLHEVKTNKEYQAVLKEIEGMEKKNGEIEESILVLLDEVDAGRAVAKAKEKEQSEEQGRYETRRKDLQRQLDAIASELQKRQEDGEALRKNIPPDLLKKYEAIRNIRNGLAVVSVWKEVCDGCHMNIPPQMYNELHTSNEMLLCPQCNRIIYWYDQNANDA